QSVRSEAAPNISAGPQLHASRAKTMSQSVQPRARRASEWRGTAISSVPAGSGAVGRARVISDMAEGRDRPPRAGTVISARAGLVRAGEAGGEIGDHLLHRRLVARLVGFDEGGDALLVRIVFRLLLHRLDPGELGLDLGGLRVLLGVGELIVRLHLH